MIVSSGYMHVRSQKFATISVACSFSVIMSWAHYRRLDTEDIIPELYPGCCVSQIIITETSSSFPPPFPLSPLPVLFKEMKNIHWVILFTIFISFLYLGYHKVLPCLSDIRGEFPSEPRHPHLQPATLIL